MTPFQTIVRMVLEETGLRWGHLSGENRSVEAVRARWMICWAMRVSTGMSYPMIGRKFNQDNSSARHGYRRAIELRQSDLVFKAFTDRLVAAVPDKDVPE